MNNRNEAPDPLELRGIVAATSYRDWRMWIVDDYDRGQGCRGMTLLVQVTGPDTYHPETRRTVVHLFEVPAAAYDERSWLRWLFDRLCEVELHEAMEWFVVEGVRPYAPNHGPGRNPYVVHELGLDIDARTSFRGEVKPPEGDGDPKPASEIPHGETEEYLLT